MEIPSWVSQLFRSIDGKDAEAFAAFLTEDAEFRYGSQPAVLGRAAVREHIAGFFSSLEGLGHELRGFWWGEAGEVCFIQGEVTYALPGGSTVTLPFLNQFVLRAGRIHRYLIYADPTPLGA